MFHPFWRALLVDLSCKELSLGRSFHILWTCPGTRATSAQQASWTFAHGQTHTHSFQLGFASRASIAQMSSCIVGLHLQSIVHTWVRVDMKTGRYQCDWYALHLLEVAAFLMRMYLSTDSHPGVQLEAWRRIRNAKIGFWLLKPFKFWIRFLILDSIIIYYFPKKLTRTQ